jgi:sugar O-acyltransferase (sialic acid O-acetyltransferase NeuD family)
MKNIIIFGTGSYAKLLFYELILTKKYKILGFVDERQKQNTVFIKYKNFSYKTIQIDDKFKNKNISGIIAIGDNYLRYQISKLYSTKLKKINWITYISNKAIVSKLSVVGKGTVILSNAVITAGTKIGIHCLINTSCSIDHDNYFHDFSSTGPGVTTAGKVEVKKFSFLGTGSTVAHKVIINENIVVGGHAYVNKDCKKNSVYYGLPAKFKRERKLGEIYLK